VDGRAPYLSALVVDYGTDSRFAGFVSTKDKWCFGDSTPTDPGCRTIKQYVMKETPYQIVTRGWIDVRNRHSWSRTEPVTPGRTYDFRWGLVPEDYVFKPGHRIGLVVLATDHEYTLRYPAGTKVSVRLDGTSLSLPVSGG
jgi:X-Pro dipeptidyl-peptidase